MTGLDGEGPTGPGSFDGHEHPAAGADERHEGPASGPSAPAEEAPADEAEVSEGLDTAVLERDAFLNDLRRLQADFENYKKRVIKQQTELLERAAEALVVKLLPVIDSLDLAVAHADTSGDDEARALLQVAAMLDDLLGKEGLERIDPLGERFDPTAHEAVMHEEGGEDPEVTEVLRPGFRWKGRVIRPAMVKVKG